MKSTGIVRKIDGLGRIVLPIELRRTLEIGDSDSLEIFIEDNTIILKKYQPRLRVLRQRQRHQHVQGAEHLPRLRGGNRP